MLPSPIVDMKAFVPAKDHKISKAFYSDLGFTINWSNYEIAELELGAFRFYCKSSTSPNMRAIS